MIFKIRFISGFILYTYCSTVRGGYPRERVRGLVDGRDET